MTALTMEELLAWNQEAAGFWKAYFEAHPEALQLPCTIDNAGVLQELVRHIWMAEYRWVERVEGHPMTPREALPKGPLQALFALHTQADARFRALLADAAFNWEQRLDLDYDVLSPELRQPTRRKAAVHALLHSQRHWAQITTLVREAGIPSGFMGDPLFTLAIQ